MPAQHIIIEALIVIAGLAVIGIAFVLARWEERDDYRRLERRAHLNLMRQGGDWS